MRAEDATREFERQVETLRRLGHARIAGVSDAELTELVAPLEARLPANGTAPFAIVFDRALVPAAEVMPLIEHRGRRGFVDMNPTEPSAFDPIAEVDVPKGPAYLVVGVDTGRATLNVTPNDALATITREGRSPLTIEEGVAILAVHPGILGSMNAFSLLGSRRGDKRVPALWNSKAGPRLGWCWAGNPHTWLGSASCGARLSGP